MLKIINRACQEKTVAMDLTRNHGINTWLINVINSRFVYSVDVVSWKLTCR